MAVSFLVVGLPHVLPCPVPRTSFADSEMTEDGRRRRKRRTSPQEGTTNKTEAAQAAKNETGIKTTEPISEAEMMREQSRECPVPKPTGIIGRVFGFASEPEKTKPTEIQIARREG